MLRLYILWLHVFILSINIISIKSDKCVNDCLSLTKINPNKAMTLTTYQVLEECRDLCLKFKSCPQIYLPAGLSIVHVNLNSKDLQQIHQAFEDIYPDENGVIMMRCLDESDIFISNYLIKSTYNVPICKQLSWDTKNIYFCSVNDFL